MLICISGYELLQMLTIRIAKESVIGRDRVYRAMEAFDDFTNPEVIYFGF